MDSVYVERRPLTGNEVASWDIAHHLFARQLQGKVVIVASNPVGLLAALGKQWARVTRKVQRERSSTLDARLIEQLTKTIAHMQNMTLTNKMPTDHPDADVYVLSNEQLQEVPFNCHTFYVVEAIDEKRLAAIKDAMPYQSLLVFYR